MTLAISHALKQAENKRKDKSVANMLNYYLTVGKLCFQHD